MSNADAIIQKLCLLSQHEMQGKTQEKKGDLETGRKIGSIGRYVNVSNQLL